MYRLYARRNGSEVWTPWVATDNYELLMHHIKVIRSYNWRWFVMGGEVI